MKNVYPVLLTSTDDMILIEVPDFEILTQANDLPEAMDMARDAIGLKAISMQDEKEELPRPSDMMELDLEKATFKEAGETYTTFIDIDLMVYRRQLGNISVRRNVTLPSWLNQAADTADVNVSKILQEALVEKLELQPLDAAFKESNRISSTFERILSIPINDMVPSGTDETKRTSKANGKKSNAKKVVAH